MKRKSSSLVEKMIALILFLILMIFCIIFIYFKNLHSISISKMKNREGQMSYSVKANFIKQGDNIKLSLPSNVKEKDIVRKDNIRKNKVIFYLKNADGEYANKYDFYGDLSKNGIKDVKFSCTNNSAILTFIMSEDKYIKYEVKKGYLNIKFINPNSLYKKIITIDSQLGGREKGKQFNNTNEADINLSIVKKIKERLDKLPKNSAKIIYTNLNNHYMTVDERIEKARNSYSNIFISIGMNKTGSGRMSEMKGIETEYISLDPKGKKLANDLMTSILKNTNSNDRGVIPGDEEPILKDSTMTSVIVRVGFSTNKEERDLLSTDKKQEEIAKGICDAIINNIN